MPSPKNETKATVEEKTNPVPEAAPAVAANAPAPAPAPNSPQTPVAAAAAGKKSLGPKEPPPFVWKLIGRSGYHVLTLFKAAEREDADAQLARLTREGYYKDLAILDIDAAVKQPKQPKSGVEPKKSTRPTVSKPPSGPKRAIRQPVIAIPKVKKATVVEDKKKKTSKAKASKKAPARKTAAKKAPAKKTAARKTIKKKK